MDALEHMEGYQDRGEEAIPTSINTLLCLTADSIQPLACSTEPAPAKMCKEKTQGHVVPLCRMLLMHTTAIIL